MSKKKVHQPHDKLVKLTLTIPEVAQDFINHHLPTLKKHYQLSVWTLDISLPLRLGPQFKFIQFVY